MPLLLQIVEKLSVVGRPIRPLVYSSAVLLSVRVASTVLVVGRILLWFPGALSAPQSGYELSFVHWPVHPLVVSVAVKLVVPIVPCVNVSVFECLLAVTVPHSVQEHALVSVSILCDQNTLAVLNSFEPFAFVIVVVCVSYPPVTFFRPFLKVPFVDVFWVIIYLLSGCISMPKPCFSEAPSDELNSPR